MIPLRARLVGVGAVGGYVSWKLADAAREYCGSYEISETLLDTETVLEPFVSIVVGVALALVIRVPTRSDSWAWRLAPFVLLMLLLMGMVWIQMAWLGTPAGGTSDSGRCAVSNVPAWWPGWMPV
ncbi:hypothetical protein [Streptomyces sp. KR80]|uniref:hypothetical protein n=1 Tax=Streptomyces sp. KR80 TaxID=3457426 RepID=UPI003FD2DE5D